MTISPHRLRAVFFSAMVVVALGVIEPARAQLSGFWMTNISQIVTNGSVTNCVKENPSRKTLSLFNASASGTIWYCVAPHFTSCTPAANALGSYALQPSPAGWAFWPVGSSPMNALYCVADSASVALSGYEGQ